MSSTFGEKFDSLPFAVRGPGSRFMKEFELIKRDFGTSSRLHDTFEVQLGMDGLEESENYDPDMRNVMFTTYVPPNRI
jgi:hypothetical protein